VARVTHQVKVDAPLDRLVAHGQHLGLRGALHRDLRLPRVLPGSYCPGAAPQTPLESPEGRVAALCSSLWAFQDKRKWYVKANGGTRSRL
jgi:hypothetical protein